MICPACGTENPERAKFCLECGTGLAGAAAPAREERKVVSVVFCDLVGFTSRAERLDPEDVRAVLGPYHARLRSELERFGGTVEKFIGDAVMAVFGAPVAHEDDPERAVRAALAIREAIAAEGELQVRIGITTGEALVNLGARPESGEGMASGDVVNTAARLESAAPVDGILVDETTFRATERAIEYRQAEPVLAKGKAEPVAVWEAAAARSRLGLDVGERTRTPLIGRDLELELITGALARARVERAPQLVTLVGVPGIGKSRLLLELFRRVHDDRELIRWRQGRCLPYGEGVTLWALAEIVKAETGILETDAASAARDKLERAVRDVVLDAVEAAWVERHLAPLVGVDGGVELADDRRDEAFAAWRRFFEGVADRGPLVLVVEDLQWADGTLLDFVDHLVDWVSDVPLLVVATARPELLTVRPHWGGGKPNAATHSLTPLSDEETAALVHVLLGRSVLGADVQRSLLDNAGGNPLYAEEFARMLEERGEPNGELSLPESVQGIIAARLDGLDPFEKTLLQDAAVIGKVFWLGALEALGGEERWRLERRLHELERRELVRRDRQSAVGGERQYAFRHLLVREVAYGQIPRARRASKHAALAGWIEGLAPDRSEDRADMLAHHYLAALRYSEAAGVETSQLVGRAREALLEAGDRALALGVAPAAVNFYSRALELWPTGEEPPGEVLLRYGRALRHTEDDRAEDVLTRARDALLASGERPGAAAAEAALGNLYWHRGRMELARRSNDRAVELVETEPATPVKAQVLASAASRLMVADRSEDAIRVGRQALAIAERLELDELVASALNTIGSSRAHLGDTGGETDLERAVEIARAANSPEATRALVNLSNLVRERGDLRRARALMEDGIAVGKRFGGPNLRFLRGVEPIDLYFLGEWDEALRLTETFLEECAVSPHYQEGATRAGRSLILLARDDAEGAVKEIERALALAHGLDEPQALVAPLTVGARVLTETGDRHRGRRVAHEAVALVRSHPTYRFLLDQLAPFADVLGAREQMLAAYRAEPARQTPWITAGGALLEGRFLDAAGVYATMPSRPDEARARMLAAEHLAAQGRLAEADVEARKAVAFWRSVGAIRYVRQAERLLAAAS